MGKGGANPYPFWWASSETTSHFGAKPKTYDNDCPYSQGEKKKDREKEERDNYYKEKSWSQRDKERKEDFMNNDKFFNDDKSHSTYSNNNSHTNLDIDPIFKIKKSSSQEDFKKAYRKLIFKNHPDKGGDSNVFIKIRTAWENLSFNLVH